MFNENYFIYNGINSQNLGLYLTDEFTIGSIEPVVNKIHIPGKNGDLVQYDGSFENRKISVEFFVVGDDAVNKMAIAIYNLTKENGYHKLKLSTDGDYFYLARIEAVGETENKLGKLLICNITFDCKPQKFIDSGDQWLYSEFGSNYMVVLNYGLECKPLLKFSLVGALQNTINVINTNTFVLVIPVISASATTTQDIFVDCESQNVYSNTTNYNYLVGIQSFPKLSTGTTTIIVSSDGDISSFGVKTRSYIL